MSDNTKEFNMDMLVSDAQYEAQIKQEIDSQVKVEVNFQSKATDRRAKIDKINALDSGSLKEFDDFILGYKLPSQTLKAYKRGCKIFLQVAFYDLFLGV